MKYFLICLLLIFSFAANAGEIIEEIMDPELSALLGAGPEDTLLYYSIGQTRPEKGQGEKCTYSVVRKASDGQWSGRVVIFISGDGVNKSIELNPEDFDNGKLSLAQPIGINFWYSYRQLSYVDISIDEPGNPREIYAVLYNTEDLSSPSYVGGFNGVKKLDCWFF